MRLVVLAVLLGAGLQAQTTPTVMATVAQPDPSLEKVMLLWVPFTAVPAGSAGAYVAVTCTAAEDKKSAMVKTPTADERRDDYGQFWYILLRLGACVPTGTTIQFTGTLGTAQAVAVK